MTPATSRPTLRATLRATPRPRVVLAEQVRAVGLALRLPLLTAAALLAVATLFIAIERVRGAGGLDFSPESSMLPGVAGMLLPIGVWLGEDRFGADFPWTLPVERRGHALARVGAGWVWLMVSVALLVLWMLLVALLTGGSVLEAETIRVLPEIASPGPVDPATLRSLRWVPEPLLWLAPFTGATAAYLLASALALATRHLLRWIAAVVLLAFVVTGLVSEVGMATNDLWLAHAPSRTLESLLFGTYGLDALLTGRTESLRTVATLTTGQTAVVWRGLPDLGEWAAATLLWSGAGLLALWAAAIRHRERRRA